MNNAYCAGEVREVRLQDLGDRVKERCQVNIRTDDGFVNVQLNNPKRADKNYAEELFDRLRKGDFIQVWGTLEEFFYNDEYRRNITPFVSADNGWGNSIQIRDADEVDEDSKANARIAGDVLDITESYEGDERILDFEILYYNTYNPEGDEDRSRKEVLLDGIDNFGQYAKSRDDFDVDLSELKDLMQALKDTDEGDVKGIANIYRTLMEKFDPLMFNVNTYHITAKGDMADEMEEVSLHDNITVGCYLKNNTIIDEFGFSEGSENLIEVGKFKGINEREIDAVDTDEEGVPEDLGEEDSDW